MEGESMTEDERETRDSGADQPAPTEGEEAAATGERAQEEEEMRGPQAPAEDA